MSSIKVLQCPTEIRWLVKLNGRKLELQVEAVDYMIRSCTDNNSTLVDLPITIICPVGQPSTRKTAYINAVLEHFKSVAQQPDMEKLVTGFSEPKDGQHNDEETRAGILVSVPPFVLEDSCKRRVGVIMMDVWNNNGSMSEDLYLKLMELGCYISTTRIFIPTPPLRSVR